MAIEPPELFMEVPSWEINYKWVISTAWRFLAGKSIYTWVIRESYLELPEHDPMVNLSYLPPQKNS